MFHFLAVCHSKESTDDRGLPDVSRHVLLTTRSFQPLTTSCQLSARGHLKYLENVFPVRSLTIPWLQESSQHDGLKYKLHVRANILIGAIPMCFT